MFFFFREEGDRGGYSSAHNSMLMNMVEISATLKDKKGRGCRSLSHIHLISQSALQKPMGPGHDSKLLQTLPGKNSSYSY